MASPAAILEALPLAALHIKMGVTEESLRATVQIGDEQRVELERCRNDRAYWINNYVQTFDPRLDAQTGKPIGSLPFKLYEYQYQVLQWLEERYQQSQDGLVEKSRDMGATWLFLSWLTHHWLFDEGFQALLGSRKEDLVDNWEIDSLFGRLEHIVKNLPQWMLPAYSRHYMKLSNPASGNAILGESANQDFARQGRYSVILLDEFAFCEWGERIWTGTADAARSRFPISTPNGGNHFKRLRESGRINVYTLHWPLHPHKSQQWYEGERARRTAEDLAQELDISYDKSVRGRVYPEWQAIPKGNFPYMQGWPLFISWDFGLDDNTALVWWARNPSTGKWRIVDCYKNAGKTIDFYAPFVNGLLPSGLPYQFTEADIAKINQHARWGSAVHFGDPAGKQRNQVSGTSVIAELRSKYGIHIQTRDDFNEFEQRREATKLGLREVEGINIATCQELDDAMVNARYPERRETSQATSEVTKPIHNWTSHFRTAVEYFMVNRPLPVARTAPGLSVGMKWGS